MTDMDVSLRLRLLYQDRDADKAEKDLKDLEKAAQQLGRARPGSALASDLGKVGREADEAKTKIGGIKRSAEDSRQAIARIGEGFGGFRADAQNAVQALTGIQREAGEARTAVNQIGAGGFADLKGKAAGAEAAIKQIGQAADATDQKLKSMRGNPWAMGSPIASSGAPGRGGLMSTVEGAVDQFGMPIAIGGGAAYLAGALPAAGAVAAGAAINAAAKDEFTSDGLRTLGQYSEEDQARYDRAMSSIGARKGVGMSGAQSVFGLLMSGGLDADNASKMTEGAIVFGKATQAAPEDAAKTTIALKNIFGIDAGGMSAAYDAMALGGKEGQFEVPDMAKNFPSIASKMAALGEGGIDGTRLAVALGQAIRTTAGSSDEASTNFENMLGKFRAGDFIKNAKDFGIDPERTLKGAEKAGTSPILALLDEIEKKVGKDGFKLAKLMPDVQSLAGLEATLNNLPNVRSMIERMKEAEGTVQSDYDSATGNFNSQKDRLSANVGENIKGIAAPLLPALEGAMRVLSSSMEAARKREEENPLAIAPATGMVQEAIRLFTDQGGPDRPSAWSKFWFGDAADPNFNLREHMAIGGTSPKAEAPDADPAAFGQAAQTGMDAYNAALTAEGDKAASQAMGIADRIRSALGFTVSPTIAPTYIAPSSSPASGGAPAPSAAPEKHSSLIQPSGSKTTQNFYGNTNARLAQVRARRESERAVRGSMGRSLADTGPKLA